MAAPPPQQSTAAATSSSSSSRDQQLVEGPLRKGDKPEDKTLMTELHRGRVPMEILRLYGPFRSVNVVNRIKENWKPPPFAAFQGQGHTLGTPNQNALNTDTSSSMPQQQQSESTEDTNATTTEPAGLPQIDESQSITQIRFRLATGQQHGPIRFNLNQHTLADVYRYVTGQTNDQRQFVLMTSYPSTRKLENTTEKTLEQEGLKNETLMQKWC